MSATQKTAPSRPKILIVDDHAVVRRGIAAMARTSEWDICGEAGDGKEAIQEVLIHQPDLVLMDISMPVMNGLEASRQIRRLSPEIKIIILSIHDTPEMQKQIKQAGADAYLTKTANMDELQRTMRRVLGRQKP